MSWEARTAAMVGFGSKTGITLIERRLSAQTPKADVGAFMMGGRPADGIDVPKWRCLAAATQEPRDPARQVCYGTSPLSLRERGADLLCRLLAARLICSASNSVRPKEKPGSDAGLEVMKNVYVMQVSSDNFSAYSNIL